MQFPDSPAEYAKEALYVGLIGVLLSAIALGISGTLGQIGFAITAVLVIGLLAFAGVAKAVQVGIRSSRE